MATLLMRDINRETLAVTNHLGQKIILTLEAGDMISFRSKGKRYRYRVSLAQVYNLALISTIADNHKEKMDEYKAKKKAGLRTRRPKPLPYIFNKKYYESLRVK